MDDRGPEIIYPGPTPAFTPVPFEIRNNLALLPPNKATLKWAETQLEALEEVEVHNPSFAAPPPPTIRVGAWNLQQCHHPRLAADLLARESVDIVLLNKMDIGLRRSGQQHTLALLSEYIAKSTGIPRGYGAGVEFFHLGEREEKAKGSGRIGETRLGFQVNGWLTRFKTRRPALFRLGAEADFFINVEPENRLLGGRVGVAAIFELGNFDLVACSAHLEKRASADGRRRQMRQLLVGLDDFANKRPVLLGGDFCTGSGQAEMKHQMEGLFKEAEARGYEWRPANTTDQTVRIANSGAKAVHPRFDWFFIRGLKVDHPAVIPAPVDDGHSISDHDLIVLTVDIPR